MICHIQWNNSFFFFLGLYKIRRPDINRLSFSLIVCTVGYVMVDFLHKRIHGLTIGPRDIVCDVHSGTLESMHSLDLLKYIRGRIRIAKQSR